MLAVPIHVVDRLHQTQVESAVSCPLYPAVVLQYGRQFFSPLQCFAIPECDVRPSIAPCFLPQNNALAWLSSRAVVHVKMRDLTFAQFGPVSLESGNKVSGSAVTYSLWHLQDPGKTATLKKRGCTVDTMLANV